LNTWHRQRRGGARPLAWAGVAWTSVAVRARTWVVGAVAMLGRGRMDLGRAAALPHDPDTGLYRRQQAVAAIPEIMAQDDRCGHSRLVLVLIGIDHLDALAGRHGERLRRQIVALVGGHIRSQTRETDVPTDDDLGFAVYLRCAEEDQAAAFCRRLRTLLSAEQFDWQGEVIKVSISIGVALRVLGEPLDTLQVRAAHRLRQVRQAGSGRHRV
jgi:diguanylate cyclase (GGDEF)-like protein